MTSKNKVIIIGVVVLVIIGGLFAWGKINQETYARTWPDSQIKCLPNGHQNLGQHIHPRLKIVIEGEEQIIPANIGVTVACMAEVHTHDQTGKIHIESVDISRRFTLSEFFSVWGETFNKNQIFDYVTDENMSVKFFVNGIMNTDFENYIMKDNDQIEIRFD